MKVLYRSIYGGASRKLLRSIRIYKSSFWDEFRVCIAQLHGASHSIFEAGRSAFSPLVRASGYCINNQPYLSLAVAQMIVDPTRLIDRSIADLTQLSGLLEEEVRDHPTPLGSPELRACEEAVATITTLIPRLQLARNARIGAFQRSGCVNCDD